jgi:type I restriction enzyme M protein
VLTPGRYVGTTEAEDDDEPFDLKMNRLAATLESQFTDSGKIQQAIRESLRRLGYGG